MSSIFRFPKLFVLIPPGMTDIDGESLTHHGKLQIEALTSLFEMRHIGKDAETCVFYRRPREQHDDQVRVPRAIQESAEIIRECLDCESQPFAASTNIHFLAGTRDISKDVVILVLEAEEISEVCHELQPFLEEPDLKENISLLPGDSLVIHTEPSKVIRVCPTSVLDTCKERREVLKTIADLPFQHSSAA